MKAAIVVDIRHGKLHVGASARAAMQEALLVWPDGPATLSVAREQATRSVQANAYYWAVVVQALADYTGHTPDEVHDILKIKFLPKDVAIATGTGEVVAEFVLGGSTTQLTVGQFYDYIERIRQWAFDELEVDIPPGDPAWRTREDEPHAGLVAP
jgi:hypothetical protein